MKKIIFSFVATMFLLISFNTSNAVCFVPFKPIAKQIRLQYENDFRTASAVFSGEVIQLDRFKVGFRIDKIWKGETAEEIVISSGVIDEGDGKLISLSEVTSFKLGEKYLVYTTFWRKNMISKSCGATAKLEDSKEKIKFLQEIIHSEKLPFDKSKKVAFGH